MSKKLASSRNRGHSLYTSGGNQIQSEGNQFFIGIVDAVVSKDSDIKVEYSEDEELNEYLDDRNAIYVLPIDSQDSFSASKCFMINSHNVDFPLIGEAVLVVRTNIGNIVIDRLSPNAFGINYDLSDYLLNDNILNGRFSVEISDEVKDRIGLKSVEDVKPFDIKTTSKAFFGRNNQYMILDYGPRKSADAEEIEYASEGSFIRFGIKDSQNEQVGKQDPVTITLANNAKLQSILGADIESKFNRSFADEPDNGIGVESDELVFIGRRFVVIYSESDILLAGEGKLFLDFEEVIVNADKILLGSDNSKDPNVLGNELVEMIDELIGIIQTIKHITPQGPTTSLTPDSIGKLKRFKSKFLRKNNSPIHSKKVFLE